MEHGDYNAVLAVIRPIMKTLPVLSSVLEGSVEVVQAISAQVEAARKNKEDLEDLYKHAATVQAQVVISLRDRGGEDQEALLKSVQQLLASAATFMNNSPSHLFHGVLTEAKVFVVKVTADKDRGVFKKSVHATAQFFTATSMAGRIAGMKQRISNSAVVFGIAAGIRTEQRVMAVDQACREIGADLKRQAQDRHDAEERIQQELVRAQQDREKHALEQREAAERQLDAEQRVYLDKVLNPAHTAAHYASNAAEPCADGTRVQILSKLQEWAASDHGPRIYWLAGLAGTGKTTIASSFCRECQAGNVIVLSFFISRNTPDRNTITAVVSTLSHQLAQVDSKALKTIYAALKTQPPILYSNIAVQAKELLVNPLTALLATSTAEAKRIVIVIDAMDECDDFAASDGRDLLQTLVPALCQQGHDVKLFLTSRYEPELRVMLDRVFEGAQDERKTFLLHEVQESYVSADIRTFVTKGFADIRERFPRISSAWPSLYQVNELVEMSGKLFVFASTVLLWIGEKTASPVSRLTEVLAAARHSRLVEPHERSPYGYLDALYLAVLRNATSDVDPDSAINSRLRQVLFIVICGRYPVTLEVISGVFQLEDHELDPLLGSLSAVLQFPSRLPPTKPNDSEVKAFHKSFHDFLVDPKRCSDERFHILHDREEPRLALATIQAAQNLHHGGPGIFIHMSNHLWEHLLKTLLNPSLDSMRMLSAIRTLLQAGPYQFLALPDLTAENLTNIRFLFAALVNKLPEPVRTEFQQDLICLANPLWKLDGPNNRDIIALYATTAIVLHARIFPALDTSSAAQLRPSDSVNQDHHFHRSLREASKTLTSYIRKSSIKSLWETAQKCSSDLPAEPVYEFAFIKLMEICMVSRLQYTVQPVIPWFQDIVDGRSQPGTSVTVLH